MKIIKRHILPILFCIILTFSLTSCDLVKDISSTKSTTEIKDEKVQEEFDTYLDDVFKTCVTSDSVTLHYTLKNPSDYGIEDMTPTLGELSLEALEKEENYYGDYIDELKSFNYDDLTEDQQLSYSILEYYLETESMSAGLEYYFSIFNGDSGLQANLPISLCEYQFYTQGDIDTYLALLGEVSSYYDECLEFEKTKSEKGLFMPDFVVDATITQCENFIATPEENVLIDTFNTRIDNFSDLTDEEKQSYKDRNKDVVINSIVPAYQNIITVFNELKGTGTNDGGLCNFEDGKDFYEYLVKSYTGTSKSISDLETQIEEKIDSSLGNCQKIVSKNYDAYTEWTEHTYDTLDPTDTLTNLKSLIEDEFPKPADATYTVKYVAPSLEESLSPAFYMIPPIDAYKDNVIYINNYQISEDSSLNLFTTLAHEGYPGHLYQTTYFNATNPNPVRSVIDFDGYVEGWATYVEMLSNNFFSFNDNQKDVASLNSNFTTFTLGLYAMTDIGVNYDGWTREDTADYFDSFGYDQEVSDWYYEKVVEDPGNVLKYYVGYLEFDSLRKTAESKLEDDFDPVEFHKTILDIGPAPFDKVEEAVNTYIDSYLN